jgi:hypothetical protein
MPAAAGWVIDTYPGAAEYALQHGRNEIAHRGHTWVGRRPRIGLVVVLCVILCFLAGDAQSIARSDLRWRRDLLLDHQLLYRHHRLVVEEEPEPAPEIGAGRRVDLNPAGAMGDQLMVRHVTKYCRRLHPALSSDPSLGAAR